MQRAYGIAGDAAPAARVGVVGYTPVKATDAFQLSGQARDWNFEFTQLKRGAFSADGAVLDLGGVSLVRVSLSDTLLHRGYAPRHMVSVFIPGRGSGAVFAQGQRVDPGHCVTLADGAYLEAVTHGRYMDVAVGFDPSICRARLELLNGGPLDVALGTGIAAPGFAWIDDMLDRVDWVLTAVHDNPESLKCPDVPAILSDRLLAGILRFDDSRSPLDSSTRSARVLRRFAVRRAQEYIHSQLSEPLRLSDLCRHAQLKVRSLEYGFREVTGLTPVAYIRSLRLNAVRRFLQTDATAEPRSISQIAMDMGFWHLGQFAVDYRLFFGETPSETRRRK